MYNLVGIEDESTNNDWDGFNGPPVMPILLPNVPVPADPNPQNDQSIAFNADDLSD
jgi:hypothetical protein